MIREVPFTSKRKDTQRITWSSLKKVFGYKSVKSELQSGYIRLIQFDNIEFEVATATPIEEAKQVLSSGYDYVTKKRIVQFQRPKRFIFMFYKLQICWDK